MPPIIYSTDHGTMCPGCSKPVKQCVCRQVKKASVPASAGRPVRVRYETKGRKGKGVTIISGLPLSEAALEELARKLKTRFGTGGAVKDGVIELQGDHRAQVEQELRGHIT